MERPANVFQSHGVQGESLEDILAPIATAAICILDPESPEVIQMIKETQEREEEVLALKELLFDYCILSFEFRV